MKLKNERKVLAKELSMARVYAQAGDRIEFSSKSAGTHDIYANGIPAELKRVKSHNNIIGEAKDAVKRQGAKLVYFEFSQENQAIHDKISELRRKGYKGKYFFSKRKKVHDL